MLLATDIFIRVENNSLSTSKKVQSTSIDWCLEPGITFVQTKCKGWQLDSFYETVWYQVYSVISDHMVGN